MLSKTLYTRDNIVLVLANTNTRLASSYTRYTSPRVFSRKSREADRDGRAKVHESLCLPEVERCTRKSWDWRVKGLGCLGESGHINVR